MDRFPSLTLLVALCFITGHQSASLQGRSSCLVNDIQLKEDFDVKKFTGKWYDIGRLEITQQNNDLVSGYSQFILTDDGQLEMHYVGEIAGECQKPIVGLSDIYWGPLLDFIFSPNPQGILSVPYWIVDTDYVNYAVIYNCYNQIWDGKCQKDSGTVQVLGRQKVLGAASRAWLENLVEERLCVDSTKMRYVWHRADCPSSQPNSLWNIWGMLNDDPAVDEEEKDENKAMEEEDQLTQVDQPEIHEHSSGQNSGEEEEAHNDSSGQSSAQEAEMHEDSSAEMSGEEAEIHEDFSGHSSGEETEMHEDSSAEMSGEETETIHEVFSGESSGEETGYDDKEKFKRSPSSGMIEKLLAKLGLEKEDVEHFEELEALYAEPQADSDPHQQEAVRSIRRALW